MTIFNEPWSTPPDHCMVANNLTSNLRHSSSPPLHFHPVTPHVHQASPITLTSLPPKLHLTNQPTPKITTKKQCQPSVNQSPSPPMLHIPPQSASFLLVMNAALLLFTPMVPIGEASNMKKNSGDVRQIQLPPHHNFSRQVSLETGFAALNAEVNGGKNTSFSPRGAKERRILSRNGKSMGPTTVAVGGSDGARKGDFSMFRTKSSLHKQQSMLPIRKESGFDSQNAEGAAGEGGGGGGGGREESINQSVPAGRYFAALRGPELDEVKDSEDILLPTDQVWPFLLRFPINCFGICLGLGSQTILWQSLSTSPAMSFLHITPFINTAIWFLAILILLLVSLTYALKTAFYFEAVRREYFHPVRVNFFFAPWISCMFLAIGAPPSLSPAKLHPAVWCALFAPVFLLELKI